MLKRFGNYSLKHFKPANFVRPETRSSCREHFIPLRPSELVEALIEQSGLTASEEPLFRTLCRQLERFFHNESQQQLARLRDVYAHANPDRDTRRLRDLTSIELERTVCELFESVAELLERANFRRLTNEQIEGAIGEASVLGVRLHVELDDFDRLAVFARGSAIVTHRKRSWNSWFQAVEVDVPIYERLVVIFRLKASEGPVKTSSLRLFKNVPHQDVDMTLPGGQIRISLLDRGKILLPTISGIGLMSIKIFKGVLLLAFAGFYGLLAVTGLLLGLLGSGMKTVNGYVRTKHKYELSLTKNLYYQNLDNNAGVLLRLAAEAEAQELRETILLYFVLLTGKESDRDERYVHLMAEQTLRGCGLEVDFELKDAMAKLIRLRLLHVNQGSLRVIPLPEAAKTVMAQNLRSTLSV